jgi:hypothetical protein
LKAIGHSEVAKLFTQQFTAKRHFLNCVDSSLCTSSASEGDADADDRCVSTTAILYAGE